MQGTLRPLQGLGTGPHGTLGQLRLHNAGQTLEVVVAGVAEVGGAETEVDGNRATVAALVLQEICPVLGTNLSNIHCIISGALSFESRHLLALVLLLIVPKSQSLLGLLIVPKSQSLIVPKYPSQKLDSTQVPKSKA